MWGQHWGQMIWGHPASVPAVGFWSTLLLGAVLGAFGWRALRGARPRTVAAVALALAFALPLTATALPFVFTNGTVADANQVNANFAALVPVTGFNEVLSAGIVGQTKDIFAPSFVAPRALTCLVAVQIDVTPPSVGATGTATAFSAKNENGVVTLASAPPQGGAAGAPLLPIPENQELTGSATRLYTVASGSTVQFGARVTASGSLTASTSLAATVVWTCQ